ncbi:hypothetical protein JHK86_004080 [Glycine max]|nr:hypothetical protein JHK86_004080 [Glycine max]
MKDIVFLWQRVTLFAKSMLVNLPLLHEEIFISGQLKTLDVAFINVAKMFVWGNGLIEVTDLITDRGNGQLTVLLSRNFKEAHCIHSWTTLDEDPLTHLLELDQSMSINEILGQVFRTSTSTSGEVQVLVLVLMGASAGALAVAAASSGGIAGASSTTDAAGVVAGANINTVNPYYSSCHQQFPRHYGLN